MNHNESYRPRMDSLHMSDFDRQVLIDTLTDDPDGASTGAASAAGNSGVNTPVVLPEHTENMANSHESSGSNFLSSVFSQSEGRPASGSISSTAAIPVTRNRATSTDSYAASILLSHTPPVASSYENHHFGKRQRSGSVSGRLRSASEYLEERGLLDRQTKGILKDLIIIGDEEMQGALDLYEQGDPSALEKMIQDGELSKRLPQDLDILGDLDLDFLTVNVNDDETGLQSSTVGSQMADNAMFSSKKQLGAYDDGIGDLEFTNDLEMEHADPGAYASSRHPSLSGTPQDNEESLMSDHEKRVRANSLFSALLNEHGNEKTVPSLHLSSQWLDHPPSATAATGRKPKANNVAANSSPKRSVGRPKKSGIASSFKRESSNNTSSTSAVIHEHVPGSGRPRSLSDPNLSTAIDEDGFLSVDRPDGWVGAYSPDSRKARIERFLKKRSQRVWTKSVKYDVRKNFADSRFRVKGRFVKKEDELLMRELMSLT